MSITGGYTLTHGAAYAGQVTSLRLSNIDTKLNKGADNIPYGKAVVTDGDDGAKLAEAGSTAAQFNGVAVYELNRAYTDAETFGAQAGRDFSVLTVGSVAVRVDVNVSKDDEVFFRTGANNTGDFSNVAGSGATASVQIPGAKFLTSANAGELAEISLVIGG